MSRPWLSFPPTGGVEVGVSNGWFLRWDPVDEYFCVRLAGRGVMVRNRAKAPEPSFSERYGMRRSWVVAFLSKRAS